MITIPNTTTKKITTQHTPAEPAIRPMVRGENIVTEVASVMTVVVRPFEVETRSGASEVNSSASSHISPECVGKQLQLKSPNRS